MTRFSGTDAQHMGTLWMLNLNEPFPASIVPRIPAVFTRVGPETTQELAQALTESQEAILQRFNTGRHCYIGRVDGELATYGWVSFNQGGIGEFGLSMRFKADEAYIWDCATLMAYRGQHLYPALLAHILNQLHREGRQRVWIGANVENLHSQRGFIRVGFQPIVDIMQTVTPAMNSLWMRGHLGASEKDVEDARALFEKEVTQT